MIERRDAVDPARRQPQASRHVVQHIVFEVAEQVLRRVQDFDQRILPMLLPLFAVLLLLTYVPQTVTFLPDLILGPQ